MSQFSRDVCASSSCDDSGSPILTIGLIFDLMEEERGEEVDARWREFSMSAEGGGAGDGGDGSAALPAHRWDEKGEGTGSQVGEGKDSSLLLVLIPSSGLSLVFSTCRSSTLDMRGIFSLGEHPSLSCFVSAAATSLLEHCAELEGASPHLNISQGNFSFVDNSVGGFSTMC